MSIQASIDRLAGQRRTRGFRCEPCRACRTHLRALSRSSLRFRSSKRRRSWADFLRPLLPVALVQRAVWARRPRTLSAVCPQHDENRELNLRDAALLTPTSKQPSERELLRVHVPVVVNAREFTAPQCTGSMTSEVKLKRRERGARQRFQASRPGFLRTTGIAAGQRGCRANPSRMW